MKFDIPANVGQDICHSFPDESELAYQSAFDALVNFDDSISTRDGHRRVLNSNAAGKGDSRFGNNCLSKH